MKFLLFASFFCSVSALANMSAYIDKFKKINLDQIKTQDLYTGKPYRFNKGTTHQTIKLWSINCANCLWQIEDQKNQGKTVLINVDEVEVDIAKARDWLKNKGIFFPSLHDDGSIRKLIGEHYPIPVSLKVINDKISNAEIGYWRKSTHE